MAEPLIRDTFDQSRAPSVCLSGVFVLFSFLLAPTGGCRSNDAHLEFAAAESYLPFVQQIEYPDVCECDCDVQLAESAPPPSVRSEETEKWPMTLDEAIQIALSNSTVIRDLGGRVVSAPETAPTVFDPALAEADPRFGVEAALSEFDAQLDGHLFVEQTDRVFNNRFVGAGQFGLLSNLADFHMGITKIAATGTEFTLENQTNYNRNTSLANLFPGAYDTSVVARFRHALGTGVEFMRIAGPQATPGNYNGVLLARINTDVSLADFEAAVRDLLRDVENTYWELYFAYRDFDAKVVGRRLALESWQLENRRAEAGIRTADQEAFARQQYYLAQIAVENALSGNLSGGDGVYAVERQLRSLLGLPATDGRVMVPSDEPATVDLRFDWHESMASALTRRVELRRQLWNIKRRELEVVAARKFANMSVNLIGEYRWRGFGDDLFGNRHTVLGSAFDTLFDGNLQDWRIGIEVATPVGNRVGHAAVRHAEWQLVRERAVHDETERQIASQLRAAFTELDRAYAVSRSNYNRRVATFIRLQAERQRNEKGQTDLDLVLDAQREAVDAESSYYRAVVDYSKALVNLHYARGTLLDHYQVFLAEGPWSAEAHRSAAKLMRRFRRKQLNYCLSEPAAISVGAHPQQYEPLPHHLPEPVDSGGGPAPTPAAPLPASP